MLKFRKKWSEVPMRLTQTFNFVEGCPAPNQFFEVVCSERWSVILSSHWCRLRLTVTDTQLQLHCGKPGPRIRSPR